MDSGIVFGLFSFSVVIVASVYIIFTSALWLKAVSLINLLLASYGMYHTLKAIAEKI